MLARGPAIKRVATAVSATLESAARSSRSFSRTAPLLKGKKKIPDPRVLQGARVLQEEAADKARFSAAEKAAAEALRSFKTATPLRTQAAAGVDPDMPKSEQTSKSLPFASLFSSPGDELFKAAWQDIAKQLREGSLTPEQQMIIVSTWSALSQAKSARSQADSAKKSLIYSQVAIGVSLFAIAVGYMGSKEQTKTSESKNEIQSDRDTTAAVKAEVVKHLEKQPTPVAEPEAKVEKQTSPVAEPEAEASAGSFWNALKRAVGLDSANKTPSA